jgi:hypothetical protein
VSSEDAAMFEPKRRGLWFKLVVGLCALVLIVAGWLFLERIRGQAALRKYEKELIAKGEKLTFAELLPPLPDGPNRAIELVGLCSSFQTGAVLTANAPAPMRCIAPGKAIVITKEPEWFDQKAGRLTWQQVGEDLERNRAVLNELRQTVRSPVLRFPINYRGMNTMLPHLARQKGAAQWLSGSALYRIHQGDIGDAVDDIESTIALTRLVEHEPIIISQFVRSAVITIAIESCWPLLHHEHVPQVALVRLQKIFGDIDAISPMILALQGEQVMGRDTIELMRSAQVSFDDIVAQSGWSASEPEEPHALANVPYADEMQGAIRAHVIFPSWRYAFSHQDEKHLLEKVQGLIGGVRLAQTNKSAVLLRSLEIAVKERENSDFRSWRYFATGLLVRGSAGSGSRAFHTQTHCQMAVAAIALKRYHDRHKKFPSSLNELVPEFASEVPIDYMDGKPLRYRLEGDQFVLWSVGPDGKDDNGTPKAEWNLNWTQGPDHVWPQVASEAEATAYRESQMKH